MEKRSLKSLPTYQLFLVILSYILVRSVSSEDGSASEVTLTNDEKNLIALVQKWAPKLWIHPEEEYFPGNVLEFLNYVIPTKISDNTQSDQLPTGPDSAPFFLVTKSSIDDLLKDKTSFLHGTNPTQGTVKAYAHVTLCNSSYTSFIVTYWFFFPFNEGKEVCTGDLGEIENIPTPEVFSTCLGEKEIFGSHVGDWEHMSIQIKDSVPTVMYLSVHNFGLYYTYDKAANNFILTSAVENGIGEAQDPPKTVQIIDNHPVLFVAKGSHAVWASDGTYKYTKLPLKLLSDSMHYGYGWETWRDLDIFYSEATTPNWFNYEGKWGNPKSGCFALLEDICLFTDGPSGLSTRKLDFDCTL